MTLSLPLTQGCVRRGGLSLGYYRWLPTGAGRFSAHRMADVAIRLELLAEERDDGSQELKPVTLTAKSLVNTCPSNSKT
jgi:hypothetical protein